MSDEEFMEWWNGCRWDKTGTELDAWPREKLAELQKVRDALAALIYTAERSADLIVSVSDRYDLDVAVESAKEALK